MLIFISPTESHLKLLCLKVRFFIPVCGYAGLLLGMDPSFLQGLLISASWTFALGQMCCEGTGSSLFLLNPQEGAEENEAVGSNPVL